MAPVGHGEGTFEGADNAITAFNITSGGLRWNATLPDDLGNLIMEGRLDTDGDLIPDEIEVATGTSPNSDDTDGDGLMDGNEDKNQNGAVDAGEVDPRKWDTDGDLLSDGLEFGLTVPEGSDTNGGTFRSDQDPGTTTDPTYANSDNDCLTDGEEDANQNGRVDPSETSPLVRDNNNDLDCDGLSNDLDPCPHDLDNDSDGDAICVDMDPCPSDIGNDADQDGLCRSDGDCDDFNPEINLRASEICDGLDNNCNGQTDEGFGDVCDNPRYEISPYEITDLESGLVWQRSPRQEPVESWTAAVDFCQMMNSGTEEGWHLPTVEEFNSLLDKSQSNPALPINHPFNNIRIEQGWYWTSTTDPQNSDNAFYVDMIDGNAFSFDKRGYLGLAWCVRSDACSKCSSGLPWLMLLLD